MAAACDDPGKRVYVGGVAGFDSLGDPAASAQLRATDPGEFYMHLNALVSVADDSVNSLSRRCDELVQCHDLAQNAWVRD